MKLIDSVIRWFSTPKSRLIRKLTHVGLLRTIYPDILLHTMYSVTKKFSERSRYIAARASLRGDMKTRNSKPV